MRASRNSLRRRAGAHHGKGSAPPRRCRALASARATGRTVATFLTLAVAAAAPPVLAQTSAGFKLEESVLNAGGHPAAGQVLTSASVRVSLDALGDATGMVFSQSASFRMDGGFVAAYGPPGEVLGLVFTADDTLAWSAEPRARVYNLYRDGLGTLSGLSFGQCVQQEIGTASTTDAETPPPGDGFFYVVTAENRIAEEGTKGAQGNGAERGGTSCP